ncbi:TolC family protein [Hydrogenimonas sp.]
MRRARHIALAALAGLGLTGCTKLGPDFVKPAPPPVSQELQKKADDKARQEAARWWRIFDDAVLDTLIQKAYAQNLDLQSAGLRILQARAALGIATGMRYPQKQTLSGSYATSYQKGHIDSANLAFDTLWEMDVWGKYARGVESAEASYYASVASYREILVAVLAEVARHYIAYRTAEERIAYAKRNIAIQERVTRMTEIQFNAGNVSELDMQQSRTQLYNTRAALPALELNKIAALNALAVLLGTTPETVRALVDTHDYAERDRLNDFIATGKKGTMQLIADEHALLGADYVPEPRFDPWRPIDAQLLTQRPDVKVAEYRAHAAAAQIGAKEALLYPSCTLFGSVGLSATDRNPVFRGLRGWGSLGDNLVVAAGPGFSWNLFQYGRLKNQVRLQDALFEENLVNYSKRVLQAASEVSNALHGYLLTKKQLEERKKALEATVRAFNISVVQYHDGLVSYQRLLSTVEKLTLTQDIYAQMRGAAATNVVYLYKALGGGWQASDGQAYLGEATVRRMKARGVDWGGMLEANATKLPVGWNE